MLRSKFDTHSAPVMVNRLVNHRIAEKPWPAHRTVVPLPLLPFGLIHPNGFFVRNFRIDLLCVKYLLVLLKLGVSSNKEKVPARIGKDEEGFPFSGHLGDMPLRERLDPCDLRRSRGFHSSEAGFGEELFFLLEMVGASWEEKRDGEKWEVTVHEV